MEKNKQGETARDVFEKHGLVKKAVEKREKLDKIKAKKFKNIDSREIQTK